MRRSGPGIRAMRRLGLLPPAFFFLPEFQSERFMRETLPGGRRGFALAILLAVFAVNFMDRQLVAILAEPIKRDLSLSDTEIALLYGFAFAVLYTSAGLPIARLADRTNRARIIGWSLMVFSAMTIACGLATNYFQFLLGRIGVAVGEGGTNPPSHSILADAFPLEKRTTAMAVFSLGPNLGILFGFLIAGWVAQIWGWRLAFVVAGVGGLAFALLILRFLEEPSRHPVTGLAQEQSSGRAVLRSLLGQSSTRHLLAGATVFSIAVYALVGWLPSFLIRSHGFSTAGAASVLAVILGAVGALGTLASGLIADRLGSHDPARRLQTVGFALVAVAPIWAAVFLVDDWIMAVTLLILPGGLLAVHLAPTFAMVQSLAHPSMRATAAALLLFVTNLVGFGLGPVAVGALSDALMPSYGKDSLKMALLLVPPLCLWAGYHYHAAERTIEAELTEAAVERP